MFQRARSAQNRDWRLSLLAGPQLWREDNPKQFVMKENKTIHLKKVVIQSPSRLRLPVGGHERALPRRVFRRAGCPVIEKVLRNYTTESFECRSCLISAVEDLSVSLPPR